MTSDTSLSPILPKPKPVEPPRFKFRVRFRKAQDLRLVSHHDLMHVCERMFRRADLSIPVTQGFNPRPKMWFASAMALGIAGLNEVLEFELTESISEADIQHRLTAKAPPGFEILSVRTIDAKTSARVRRALYRCPTVGIEDLQKRCDEFMARTECWVERLRPHPRRINVRPFVHELHPYDDRLELALWITPNGAARPDEIIIALGLGSLLDAGAVIDRTDLEIFDELPIGTEGPPLITSAIEEIGTNDREPAEKRPTAIISSPMSFDS